MSNAPLYTGGNYYTSEGDSGIQGSSITASATAHTKGSWVELVASTVGRTSGVTIQIFGTVSNTSEFLIDIGVGAAASEQVVVENLPATCGAQFAPGWHQIFLPLSIPDGTRVAARCQSSAASSSAIQVALILSGATPYQPTGLSKFVCYGVNTGTTLLTALAASFGSKGSYSQITAATEDRPARSLHLIAGNEANTNRTNGQYVVDVAIGAAASETIILPDLYVAGTAQETVSPHYMGPFPVNLPASTRIAVRQQSSGASVPDVGYAVLVGY